ncbi:MAG: hypothetical protein QM760_16675 [Nibricoccus sp.]
MMRMPALLRCNLNSLCGVQLRPVIFIIITEFGGNILISGKSIFIVDKFRSGFEFFRPPSEFLRHKPAHVERSGILIRTPEIVRRVSDLFGRKNSDWNGDAQPRVDNCEILMVAFFRCNRRPAGCLKSQSVLFSVWLPDLANKL